MGQLFQWIVSNITSLRPKWTFCYSASFEILFRNPQRMPRNRSFGVFPRLLPSMIHVPSAEFANEGHFIAACILLFMAHAIAHAITHVMLIPSFVVLRWGNRPTEGDKKYKMPHFDIRRSTWLKCSAAVSDVRSQWGSEWNMLSLPQFCNDSRLLLLRRPRFFSLSLSLFIPLPLLVLSFDVTKRAIRRRSRVRSQQVKCCGSGVWGAGLLLLKLDWLGNQR